MVLFALCRILWRIFCIGGLVVIYCFSFYYHGRLLLLHLFWMIVLLGRVS
jgi:hypothetical protein